MILAALLAHALQDGVPALAMTPGVAKEDSVQSLADNVVTNYRIHAMELKLKHLQHSLTSVTANLAAANSKLHAAETQTNSPKLNSPKLNLLPPPLHTFPAHKSPGHESFWELNDPATQWFIEKDITVLRQVYLPHELCMLGMTNLTQTTAELNRQSKLGSAKCPHKIDFLGFCSTNFANAHRCTDDIRADLKRWSLFPSGSNVTTFADVVLALAEKQFTDVIAVGDSVMEATCASAFCSLKRAMVLNQLNQQHEHVHQEGTTGAADAPLPLRIMRIEARSQSTQQFCTHWTSSSSTRQKNKNCEVDGLEAKCPLNPTLDSGNRCPNDWQFINDDTDDYYRIQYSLRGGESKYMIFRFKKTCGLGAVDSALLAKKVRCLQQVGRNVAVIGNMGLHYHPTRNQKTVLKRDLQPFLSAMALANQSFFFQCPALHFWTEDGSYFDPSDPQATFHQDVCDIPLTKADHAAHSAMQTCDQSSLVSMPFSGVDMHSQLPFQTCKWNGNTCRMNRAVCVPHSATTLAKQDSKQSNDVAEAFIKPRKPTTKSDFSVGRGKYKTLAVIPAFHFTEQRWDMHARPESFISLPYALSRVPVNVDCLHPCSDPLSALYWEPQWHSLTNAIRDGATSNALNGALDGVSERNDKV
jgi:hypothetical protein